MINGILSKCHKTKYITSLLCQVHRHLIVRYDTTKSRFKMNEAYLQYAHGNETFNFTFRYINDELAVDRQFNLSRRKSENVESFLRRIDTNVTKILHNKKKRRAKKNKEIAVEENLIDNVGSGNIVLLKQNSKIGLSESCTKLLDDPSQLSMIILGVSYTIKFNAPSIISMKLPKSLLSGFPVYPSEFESLFTDKSKSKFTWYTKDHVNNNKFLWKEVGDGYIYIPTNEDIGSTLKLKCLPRNDKDDGPEVEVESIHQVEAGPGTCPFELRHSFTQTKLSGNNFRITSYNILANTYADSDYSREVLFPYCPPYALAIDYRKLLIIKELIGYNSDIICLQEVDKKIYENDIKSALSLNYEGVYSTKGEMSEGLAIIYNKMRFEQLDVVGLVISKNIDSNKIFKNIWDKMTNENAQKRFLARNTSILIVTLRSLDNPREILVIGNTHLYFHPDADHIRLLQAYHALTACQETATKIREKHPDHNVTLILSGDFNSTPINGVYELMTKNCIPEEHKDWRSNADEKVENVSLTHDLSLASACGTPQYTNFTVDFADCLDYIFYESNKLIVTEVIPMPSKEELTLHSAIPSVVFPSDHIAICANMKWISQ